MRFVFLDSWRAGSHDGSGTAVGVATLAEALARGGHETSVLRLRRGAGIRIARRLFNLALPRRLHPLERAHPDLVVVGVDLDGRRWGASPSRRSRYLVALKGVARDEARFETDQRARRLLERNARDEERNARSADRVIVPSAYSAEVANGMYGIPQDRIRIVPEGIDLAVWEGVAAERDRAAAERPLTILSVARQYPRKDTATLLRALPRVLGAIPAARLRVVGGGPELPRLRALARALGIEAAVTFTGALRSHAEVRRAYAGADLFALPSRQEGFGIVFLEAMAAGLPVVAARAGAVPEVVADGETGILVAPGDADGLADALVALLADPSARERMGAAGRERVRRYDLPAIAEAFVAAVPEARP